jgi:hypothetical protein
VEGIFQPRSRFREWFCGRPSELPTGGEWKLNNESGQR